MICIRESKRKKKKKKLASDTHFEVMVPRSFTCSLLSFGFLLLLLHHAVVVAAHAGKRKATFEFSKVFKNYVLKLQAPILAYLYYHPAHLLRPPHFGGVQHGSKGRQ